MIDKLTFQPTEKQATLLQPTAEAMGVTLEELLRHIVEAWLADQAKVASQPQPILFPIYPVPQPDPTPYWPAPWTGDKIVWSVETIPSTWESTVMSSDF